MQTTTIINSINNSEKDDQRFDIFNKHNKNDDLNSISVKKPRFPPNIDVEPLVANLLKHKTKNPKMPNEFFIYRAALVKELKLNNYKLKMTRLSALASDSWSQEPPSVKSEYRKLARETERQYLSARALELPNIAKSLNNNDSEQKPKKKPSPKPVNIITNTEKELFVNVQSENNNNNSLSGINNNVVDVQLTQSTLQYPSSQPQPDFTLMGDNPCFGMRQRYDQNNQNEIYLIPPQDKNHIMYYNVEHSPISTYSSENSSPTSVYWSNPNSPSFSPLPLGSTNINDSLQEENNFFASFYELQQMNSLTINDMNYPRF